MAKENLYTPNCIRTFTGLYVNVFEPTLDMICIEDIAHSLSMQTRFGGHLPEFYSVAQHSLLCASLANDEHQLAALLHDASEAYLIDVPRPVKHGLTNYKEIENKLMILIAEKFGFTYPLTEEIKTVDELVLKMEWHELMLQSDYSPENIHPMTQKNAKRNFIALFNLLNKKRNEKRDPF